MSFLTPTVRPERAMAYRKDVAFRAEEKERPTMTLKMNGREVPEDAKADLLELIGIAGEKHLLSVREVRVQASLALRTMKSGEKRTFKAIPFKIVIERTGEQA